MHHHPLNDYGNILRLSQTMDRIPRVHGWIVAPRVGEVIGWSQQPESFPSGTDELHQHIGSDPCDDWSAEAVEYQFEGEVVRFSLRQYTCCDNSLEPAIDAAGIYTGIGQHGSHSLGRVSLHDYVPLSALCIYPQDNAAIRTRCDGKIFGSQDQGNSPSGVSQGPKVAEAGGGATSPASTGGGLA